MNDRQVLSRFVALYGLAWAGGSIAYTPLLTILLPVIVLEMAGQDAAVSWLAQIAFTGAIAASLGNILFGYLSDITGNRRGWVAAGLVLSSAALLAFRHVDTLSAMLSLVLVWQLGLNMMLGPLGALAGDVVPDERKGFLGGLMAFAPALGAMSGAVVTLKGLAAGDTRLAIVAGLVAICVVPILFVRLPSPVSTTAVETPPAGEKAPPRPRNIIVRMWLARLALQISEAALFAYVFLWFTSLDSSTTDNGVATLFSVVLLASAPLALIVGRWADRHDRPLITLAACAASASAGLLAMAVAPGIAVAVAAYAVFGISSAIFLALHTAQTLRYLPSPVRRGRDLGIFNLTNTVPSLIMPGLTLALVPTFGFPALFAILSLLAALAGILLFPLARRR